MDFTLSIRSLGGQSNIKYYYGTTSNPDSLGNEISLKENTNGTLYYAKACVNNLCSDTSNYNVKLDKTSPTIMYELAQDASTVGVTFTANDNVQVSKLSYSGTNISPSSVSGTSDSLSISYSTKEDVVINVTATDQSGRSTNKTFYLKFLFSDGNNHRIENTGGWIADYWNYLYGTLDNITYDMYNNALTIRATPTTLTQGRLASFYTVNDISLANYDKIRTLFYVYSVSGGETINLWMQGQWITYKQAIIGWNTLEGDISDKFDSQKIILGVDGNNNASINTYIGISYMYGFN